MPELTKVQTGFLQNQGPFKLDAGTAAAPGVQFGNDTSTGFYRSAENEIALSVSGTQKLKFTGDGITFNGTSLNGTPFVGKIDKSISDTATDIFIYDTSKDSDGGAWRKRTTNTSWYNETLNTSTRGSRREFPAVAVIVAEQYKITIYDGDSPDMPMWMVFNRGIDANPTWLWDGNNGNSCNSVTAINGTMMFSTSNAGSYGADFIGERWIYFYNQQSFSGYRNNGGGIVNRNSAVSSRTVNKAFNGFSASAGHNEVTITVLPNAPIDPVTGLPVPTIAVATNGGTNIIKDDGSVINVGGTVTTKVSMNQKLLFSASTANGGYYGYTFDMGGINAFFRTVSNIRILSNVNSNTNNNLIVPTSSDLYSGQTVGLSIVYKNGLNNDNYDGMVSYITSTYNTGWMYGDIKGAFLSDTNATNVTGTELVTNGDFATGTLSGWSTSGTTTPSISSGGALLTTGTVDGSIWQAISSTGKVVITWTITSNSGGFFGLFLNNSSSNGSGGSLVLDGITASGFYYYDGTITSIEFRHRGSSSGIIDNISVRTAELDRSVNSTALAVYGNITKTPVATGSNLIAYGGFSVNNYLLQTYNPAIAFGTGNFSYMGWAKATTAGGYIFQWDNPNSTNGIRLIIWNSTTVRVTVTSVIDRDFTYPALTGTWNFFVVQRVGSIIYTYINGVLVDSFTNTTNLSGTDKVLTFGYNANNTLNLSLWRVSATAPSPEQILKIYNDEKALFQPNSQCTLYGSSDAVTALAYDEVTKRLHVGTSSGRSEFQGLERINNTTTAVTTAISAHDGFIVEQ